MSKYFLGIDQGTTGATAILFDRSFAPVARGYCEIKQSYPKAGWVEHDPTDIYNAVCAAVTEAMAIANASPADILAIGIDHEGESVALWDAETGKPVYPAIVWQDRRTAARAEELNAQYGDQFRARTALTPIAIMQFQADILNLPLELPSCTEATALGTAFAAAIGVGYAKLEDVKHLFSPKTRYTPEMSAAKRQELLCGWHRALNRAKGWYEEK